MDEVGSALIAIALVLAAVFIPTAFIPGISGQFYRQFALTIAVSTLISAFISLTLSPALAAWLLKPHAHEPSRNPIVRFGSTLAGGFNRGFDATSHGYAKTVGLFVRHKLIMLPIYAGLLAGTAWVANHVPRGFIPTLDQGYAIVVVQLPDGSSLSRTDAVVQRASKIIQETPGVQDAVAFAGFSGATFTNATNAAAIFARFKSFEERVPRASRPTRSSRDLFGRMQADRGGVHHRDPAAARPRPRQFRRLPAPAPEPDRRRCPAASSRPPTRSWVRRARTRT